MKSLHLRPTMERGGPGGQASSLTCRSCYSLAVPCSLPAAWLAEDGPTVQRALGYLTISKALQEKSETTGKTARAGNQEPPSTKGSLPKHVLHGADVQGLNFLSPDVSPQDQICDMLQKSVVYISVPISYLLNTHSLTSDHVPACI